MDSFAIIPAAGRSRRMGQPKLLMPWGKSTIIESVLDVWRASRATQIVLVVHPEDETLAQVASAAGAQVVRPEVPPPQMKDSVHVALAWIARHLRPSESDAWLLAPADMPLLSATTIDQLIAAYSSAGEQGETPAIVAPTHDGVRGHPVLFSWRLAGEVASLGDNEGLDALVARHAVLPVVMPVPRAKDFDTPDEYQALRRSTDE